MNEDQGLKSIVRQKLNEGNFIAVEGGPAVLASDVIAAIDVINKLEENRDESGEWNHIRKLQQERAARFAE